MKLSVSFLGLGIMGRPMCKNLVKHGYNVTVWNRTISKAEELQKELGEKISVVSTCQEAVTKNEVTLMMLWDAASVFEVLKSLPPNGFTTRTFINMATISPEESKSIGHFVESSAGTFVEAPVLGSWTVAEKGQLQILVGSKDEAEFQKLLPIFSCFGTPRYLGNIGSGTATKLANNFILGANLVSFSESYAYLEKAGVNMETFMTILTNGPFNLAGGYFSSWSNKFKSRTYEPVSFAAHGIEKDVGLAVKEFKNYGVYSGAAEGVYKHIHEAVEQYNIGDKDAASVYEIANPKSS